MSKKAPKKRGPKPKRHKNPQQRGKTVAQQKEAKLNAAVPKGKKRAATVGRIAERRAQAEMAALDKKATVTAETRRVRKEVLKPLAKEINHRIKQAGELDGKADDHRLSAALQLEAARRQCKEAKINFERWCDQNIKKSYDEIRKLIAVARAPEPAKALADMRAGAAARNRDLRKRQSVSRDATAPASKAESAWEAAEALVSSLPDEWVGKTYRELMGEYKDRHDAVILALLQKGENTHSVSTMVNPPSDTKLEKGMQVVCLCKKRPDL